MDSLAMPAVIYKYSRTKGYIANCISKNLLGFGKTEEDALSNLKDVLKACYGENFVLKPTYGLL